MPRVGHSLQSWCRLDIEAAGTKEKPRAVKMTYHQNKGKKEVLESDRLFKTLRKYNQNTALIAASISGTSSEEVDPPPNMLHWLNAVVSGTASGPDRWPRLHRSPRRVCESSAPHSVQLLLICCVCQVDPAGGGFLGMGGAEKSDYFRMVQLRK